MKNWLIRFSVIIILFILSSFQTDLLAQTTIVGKIIDDESKEALPYSHIVTSDYSLGTASNANGQFKIIIPDEYLGESIIFSYIGYQDVSLKINKSMQSLVIELKKSNLILDEALVEGYSGISLLKKAIVAIPRNYQNNQHISKGFYRVVSKRESGYLHLSEAEFEIFRPKDIKQKNLFKLNKLRAVQDTHGSHGITIGQRPRSIIKGDIVNNLKDSDLLGKKGISNHEFTLEGLKNYKDTKAFLIRINHKKNVKSTGYSGHIYIDTETFAFLHFDIESSKNGLEQIKFGNSATRAAMKLIGMKAKTLTNRIKINYIKKGNKYFLNSVKQNQYFNIRNNRDHYNFNIDSKYQYIVTQIKEKDTKAFTKNEIIDKDKFLELDDDLHSGDFWNGYNIILPDENFTKIAQEIENKNNFSQVKLDIDHKLNKYPKNKSARVDSIITHYHRNGLFNGNALVTYDHNILLSKSFNNKLTEHKRNTQFRIGSTSKTFTAMLILMLVKEGKLSFSDKVGKILPNFIHHQITIDQLLSHRSGIPNDITENENVLSVLTNQYTTKELLDKFCSGNLEFEPGSQFKYSNSGFLVLAAVIEKLYNTPFAQVLINKIFTPLKMESSYFGNSKEISNKAKGYLNGSPEPFINTSNFLGAGGITSTTEDLLKWSQALESDELLPNQEIDILYEPRAEYTDWLANYGYGWMIDKYKFSVSKEHEIKYHPGTSLGFYAMFLKQPDKGITIILLNSTGEFPRFQMADLILDQLNMNRPSKYEN